MPLSVFHGRCPSLSLSQPCILLHTSWLDSSARTALHDLAEVENSNSAGSSLNKRLGGRGGGGVLGARGEVTEPLEPSPGYALCWKRIFLLQNLSIDENRPFARSGHMVRNKLHCDASYAVGLPKQRNSYQSSPTFLCFESPTA